MSCVAERLWWPIQSPTEEERRKQKAKRRERSVKFALKIYLTNVIVLLTNFPSLRAGPLYGKVNIHGLEFPIKYAGVHVISINVTSSKSHFLQTRESGIVAFSLLCCSIKHLARFSENERVLTKKQMSQLLHRFDNFSNLHCFFLSMFSFNRTRSLRN